MRGYARAQGLGFSRFTVHSFELSRLEVVLTAFKSRFDSGCRFERTNIDKTAQFRWKNVGGLLFRLFGRYFPGLPRFLERDLLDRGCTGPLDGDGCGSCDENLNK